MPYDLNNIPLVFVPPWATANGHRHPKAVTVLLKTRITKREDCLLFYLGRKCISLFVACVRPQRLRNMAALENSITQFFVCTASSHCEGGFCFREGKLRKSDVCSSCPRRGRQESVALWTRATAIEQGLFPGEIVTPPGIAIYIGTPPG